MCSREGGKGYSTVRSHLPDPCRCARLGHPRDLAERVNAPPDAEAGLVCRRPVLLRA